MPYRVYEKRTKSFDKAVIPDVARMKFEARKPDMLSWQEEQQLAITDFETKVRTELDKEGILIGFRIPYLNFARALYRAKGHQSDIALRKYATAEKAKAVQYGLDPDLLDRICTIVIGALPY